MGRDVIECYCWLWDQIIYGLNCETQGPDTKAVKLVANGAALDAACHAHVVQYGLSDVELASFPCLYSTADNILIRSNAGPKATVLGHTAVDVVFDLVAWVRFPAMVGIPRPTSLYAMPRAIGCALMYARFTGRICGFRL